MNYDTKINYREKAYKKAIECLQDDLVQKGYGWMLKAASEAHRAEVFSYVMNRKANMPRTALRYAIEKMPSDMRAEAMAK